MNANETKSDDQIGDMAEEQKKISDDAPNYISEHNNLKKCNSKTKHYVFFYGSCSPESISKDTGCTALESYAAILPGYVRYYARFSRARDGATASIRKATQFDKPYSAVSGWVAQISDNDLMRMDGREGHPYVYRREYVSVQLHLNIGDKTQAIQLDNVWTYFIVNCMDWIVPPSHAYTYLCCQTIQHFWQYDNPIIVRDRKCPLYEIDHQGRASKLLIFDFHKDCNRTVMRHSTKFGHKASKSNIRPQWRSKRACIRCKSKTWVCFVQNIALFICDGCKKYFNVSEK